MKSIKNYYVLRMFISLVFVTLGILLLVFSSNKYMGDILGYAFGSVLVLTGLYFIINVFTKDQEHFFRCIIHLLIISAGVVVFIRPTIFVTSVPILLAVLLIGIGSLFTIKFIIIKRANMSSLFNITQLSIFILFIALGILVCVFYEYIDVIITSIIIGIPLILFGVLSFIYDVFKLIKNKKEKE